MRRNPHQKEQKMGLVIDLEHQLQVKTMSSLIERCSDKCW